MRSVIAIWVVLAVWSSVAFAQPASDKPLVYRCEPHGTPTRKGCACSENGFTPDIEHGEAQDTAVCKKNVLLRPTATVDVLAPMLHTPLDGAKEVDADTVFEIDVPSGVDGLVMVFCYDAECDQPLETDYPRSGSGVVTWNWTAPSGIEVYWHVQGRIGKRPVGPVSETRSFTTKGYKPIQLVHRTLNPDLFLRATFPATAELIESKQWAVLAARTKTLGGRERSYAFGALLGSGDCRLALGAIDDVTSMDAATATGFDLLSKQCRANIAAEDLAAALEKRDLPAAHIALELFAARYGAEDPSLSWQRVALALAENNCAQADAFSAAATAAAIPDPDTFTTQIAATCHGDSSGGSGDGGGARASKVVVPSASIEVLGALTGALTPTGEAIVAGVLIPTSEDVQVALDVLNVNHGGSGSDGHIVDVWAFRGGAEGNSDPHKRVVIGASVQGLVGGGHFVSDTGRHHGVFEMEVVVGATVRVHLNRWLGVTLRSHIRPGFAIDGGPQDDSNILYRFDDRFHGTVGFDGGIGLDGTFDVN